MSQSPLLPTPLLDPVGDGQPPLVPPPATTRSRSSLGRAGAFFGGAWRFVSGNSKVAAGCGIIGFFVLVAIFGPLFIHGNPLRFTPAISLGPSAAHPLGTNQGGQDVFGQLVLGTRSSIFWALLAGMIVMVISVTVGLLSGYFGGFVDDALSLFTNIFLVIPSFPLAIVAVQYFNRSELTVALIVALTNWPWGARVLRAQTLSMRTREFVTAAQSSGERTWRIIFFEIFPNQLAIVAASFITTTIQVLLQVAGLEFLGFGDSSAISWGTMLYNAYNNSALLVGEWWWFAPPGICIALLGSGLALLNFGIDEFADPRLRLKSRRTTRRKAVTV